MRKTIIILIISAFFASCSENKFSNPDIVVKNFHLLKKVFNFEEEYNFLSIESKLLTSRELYKDI